MFLIIYCYCFLSDALIPSSLETFSTCVDRDDDVEEKLMTSESSNVNQEKLMTSQGSNVNQEKRVVIKLDDSDIEENRGEKNNKSEYSGDPNTGYVR